VKKLQKKVPLQFSKRRDLRIIKIPLVIGRVDAVPKLLLGKIREIAGENSPGKLPVIKLR